MNREAFTMFKSSAVAMVGFLSLAPAFSAVPRDYGLGRPASAAEVAAWDIDVRPDGKGLPKGHGSVEEGQAVYDAKCAACHGTFGESTDYIQLAGGAGSLKTSAPVRTVGSLLEYATTLFDYIYRAMPFNNSKSLTVNETYAVTAYVLSLNDILPADAVLDEKTLPRVQMPNRGGFRTDHGLMSVNGKSDVSNKPCMHNCEAKVEITSELPAGFVSNVYGDLESHFPSLLRVNHETPPATVVASATPATASQLAEKHACLVCHAIDHRVVGPAFQDVAKKYKGNASAVESLTSKVRTGGSGVWGSVPMPPQSQLSNDEVQMLVRWILAGAPPSPTL
jgi:cytochrome c